jgi:small ligand-binding sensory domain FIST
MPFFPCAHAAHPLWQHAVKQVIVQLQAQVSMQHLDDQPCLAVVYISAPYAGKASDIVAMLSKALPQVQHWVGCAGHSVLAGDMDYGHAGALAVMLPYLAAQHYQVFSSLAPRSPGPVAAHTVLIHGDASSPHKALQVQKLHQQWLGAVCIGALCDLQDQHAQWAWGGQPPGAMPMSIGGGGVQVGGLSGVVFADAAEALSVGMQGCKPLGAAYVMTRVDGDVVLELDGKPALEVFFSDVQWGDVLAQRHPNADALWQKIQSTWMAMTPPGSYVSGPCLPSDARVLKVVGIDLLRQGIVLNGLPVLGRSLMQCQWDEQAARTDIRRACAQLWESLTTSVAHASPASDSAVPMGRSICGAIYIRNQQRHKIARTPEVDAELQLIRHALGPVPLLGFSASCEIEGGELQHLSAQLLVFTQPLPSLS